MNRADWTRVTWKKSTRSNGSGDCVEVAEHAERVAVRDSKQPDDAILLFHSGQWRAFVAAAKAGQFDLG